MCPLPVPPLLRADLLCWRGHGLYDCNSEFRLFWVGSKLAEDAPGVGEMAGAPGHTRRFAPVPIYRRAGGARGAAGWPGVGAERQLQAAVSADCCALAQPELGRRPQ